MEEIKTQVSEEQVNATKDVEQVRIIKPKVVKGLLIADAFITSIWVFFFIAYIVGTAIFTFLDDSSIFVIIAAFVAVFMITIYVNYWLKKRAIEKTSYKFFDNRVEYYDGFLVKNRKTIKFSRITDVGQTRGIIERMFGLGTVGISTAGTTGYEISMNYLDNSDDVYDWLDQIISKYDK